MVSADMPVEQLTPVGLGLDVRARLNVLRRRLFFVIAFLLASLVAGAIITIHSQRVYRAVATVLIDVNAPEVLSGVREVYDLGAGYWASKEYYHTQYSVIRSRVVSQRVVSNLNLAPSGVIADLEAAAPATTQSRLQGDALEGLPAPLQVKLRMLGLGETNSRQRMFTELKRMDAVAVLQQRIRVDPVRDSRLVQIGIDDTDPAVAATLANAVAAAYIEVNLDQKTDMTRTAVDWLTSQMSDLKTKVERSELALHDFRKLNNMVSISMEDRQTMISQTLTQLNQSLSAARAQGFAYASRRDQIKKAMHNGQMPENFEEVISNPYIQKLKSAQSDLRQEEADLALRYTPEHPKLQAVRQKVALVQADMSSEVNKIIDTLSKQYDQSINTQGRLEAEIEKIKAEALDLGKKEIDYSRLKRDKDNNMALYEVVMKREKEANLTQMLKVNNVRELDAARPPRKPIRPNVQINMLAALLLGLLGGVGVAFAVDYLDNSVKSQDQIEQVIGLPFLGLVPTVKPPRNESVGSIADRDLYVLKHPRSAPAECWRTVRTNIMFMSPENPARSIVVSSSAPLEGKSTTVINLAITMALLGTRTLVVDTDMRRPRLHKGFGLKNEVGLSNLIIGDRDIDAAIQPSSVDRLDVLTCGPIPPNPAELMHTERFRTLLEQLGERYQHIILDSPPVAAVTDALVLASLVDGVVLVVHAGHSTWQATVQTKRRFEDVGGRIFGVVLNNVDLDRAGGSDYSYYRNYQYGYTSEDAKA